MASGGFVDLSRLFDGVGRNNNFEIFRNRDYLLFRYIINHMIMLKN